MSNIKKNYVIGFTLIIFFLSISPSIVANQNYNQPDAQHEKITFLKIDSNGKTTPIELDLTIAEGQDLDTAIAEKCKELCENDQELQQFAKYSGSLRTEVESKGKGLHWSFRRIILANRTVVWRSIIRYRYLYPEGYTNVKILGSDEWTTLIEGPQRVGLIGFTGYASFKPNLLWGNTTIHGYALRVEWKAT